MRGDALPRSSRPSTPPPLRLAEPGRSDRCGGLEWVGIAFALPHKPLLSPISVEQVGVAFAARHQREAGGRGLRCRTTAWSGWAWPALSALSLEQVGVAFAAPISLERVGVVCAVCHSIERVGGACAVLPLCRAGGRDLYSLC